MARELFTVGVLNLNGLETKPLWRGGFYMQVFMPGGGGGGDQPVRSFKIFIV